MDRFGSKTDNIEASISDWFGKGAFWSKAKYSRVPTKGVKTRDGLNKCSLGPTGI